MESVAIAKENVRAEIVPERGAIVTSIQVGGAELLYLDRGTLEDPAKNVRGGIPILFPFAGKLPEENFIPAGTKMKQHGFGRNKRWGIASQHADRVVLKLVQDSETRAQYPYEFEVEYAATILPRGLSVEFRVRNHGAKPLPLSPGWHPYCRCPAGKKSQVTSDVPGLGADRFRNDQEFDFGAEASANGRACFNVPGLGKIAINFTPGMRHMQFWSLPGKEFICLEPFWGPANTVNTDRRLDIQAKQSGGLFMQIELLEAGN